MSLDDFATFWQALGLPDPRSVPTRVPAALVDVLPVVSTATTELLGAQTALGLTRVIGASMARLAEAVVDAFRVEFEVPELAAGTSYTEVVERYTALTRDSLPALEATVCAVLRAHLVRVAAGRWAPDEERAATRRELFVGFVDMAGYTALSRTMSPRELTGLLGAFEDVVADAVSGNGGRLVKLIGDGAMFVTESPAGGCAAALDIAARAGQTDALPPVRVGAAWGSVLGRYGDYFGDVVNLAARLAALAAPSTAVVSDSVATTCRDAYRFERLPPQALKGFQAPEVTFRLVGPRV